MNKDKKLFDEFPPVSTEKWEELINHDLKGADYHKKLIWKTDEGFEVRPYYREEDLDDLHNVNTTADDFPYVRGYKSENNHWNVVQRIKETNPLKANKIALDAIAKGANIIGFSVQKIKNFDDLCQLLQNIPLEKVGIQFFNLKKTLDIVQYFVRFINENNFNKQQISGFINYDHLTYLLKYNHYPQLEKNNLQIIKELIELTKDLPNFKVINLGAFVLHNAGATVVQELGYILAIANEYLATLTDENISTDLVATKMGMSVSVGSNYFMEIAKLRAVRLLWSTLIEQYKPTIKEAYELPINSVGSRWNKTIYDSYVNLLRSTTEGMAASLGGASSITLQPFDTEYNNENEFSQRINRNIQIILKEESFFDKVIDPAAGSYYVENLTHAIATHAWDLFKKVVMNKGIVTLIQNGDVRMAIEESCQKRDMAIATRRQILVGSNQFPNIQEKMLEEIVLEENQEEKAVLRSYRGAIAFEKVRLATEKHAKNHGTPKVFLLKVGNVAMRQARASFTTNFFGCAGFEIIDNPGFDNVKNGVNSAIESKANIIVLCSSDEEYATLGISATEMMKIRNPNLLVVIAGNPVEIADKLKAAGVDDFIHIKTNLLQSLQNFQVKLNII